MPVIDNAYRITDDTYSYSPSDLDRRSNLSRADMNNLIDSLCKERMENPDVVLMDNIQQQRYPDDPIRQEYFELEQDNIAVEEEVLKNIFESDTPMSIEERNEYIANGLYDKYKYMKARKLGKTASQMTKEDNEAMGIIEEELKAEMLNKPIDTDIESVTEVISEEDINVSFREETESSVTDETVNESKDTFISTEDTQMVELDNITEEEFKKLYPITEQEAIKMASLDTLGREEYTEEEDIIETFKKVRESNKKSILTKEQVYKIVTGLPTAAAALANPNTSNETLDDVTEELSNTIDAVSSPETIIDAIKSTDDNNEEEHTMSLEEFNDVPATNISLPDDVITTALMKQYDDIDYNDAMQLISVMNRYKSGEKFNVFEALPESIKSIINKEAMNVGANKSTINFFAKSFINDLVNNTFLDREINDFNQQIQEVMAPMGNITGAIMDDYNDDLYEKFTTKLIEKSEIIRPNDEEKANQLITISNNFEESVKMTRLINMIKGNPTLINKHYKLARDSWNKIIYDYDNYRNTVNPIPRTLEACLKGLLAINLREDIAKTILSIAKVSMVDSIKLNTIEEHIYAYYLSNSFTMLSHTMHTSKIVADIIMGTNELSDMIEFTMTPLLERNTKKQRKRNKKNNKRR